MFGPDSGARIDVNQVASVGGWKGSLETLKQRLCGNGLWSDMYLH